MNSINVQDGEDLYVNENPINQPDEAPSDDYINDRIVSEHAQKIEEDKKKKAEEQRQKQLRQQEIARQQQLQQQQQQQMLALQRQQQQQQQQAMMMMQSQGYGQGAMGQRYPNPAQGQVSDAQRRYMTPQQLQQMGMRPGARGPTLTAAQQQRLMQVQSQQQQPQGMSPAMAAQQQGMMTPAMMAQMMQNPAMAQMYGYGYAQPQMFYDPSTGMMVAAPAAYAPQQGFTSLNARNMPITDAF